MKRILKVTLGTIPIYSCINFIPVRYTGTSNKNEMKRFEIVGHRGAAGLAPENSLSAIEKGIENEASLIEIDVHLSKDNEVIVCHDATIDRTTNGKGKIKNMTLNELKQYNIVDSDDKITDLKLPTLKEVIQTVNGRVKILLEIKSGHKNGI